MKCFVSTDCFLRLRFFFSISVALYQNQRLITMVATSTLKNKNSECISEVFDRRYDQSYIEDGKIILPLCSLHVFLCTCWIADWAGLFQMIIMQLVVVYPAGSGAEPLLTSQGRGGPKDEVIHIQLLCLCAVLWFWILERGARIANLPNSRHWIFLN